MDPIEMDMHIMLRELVDLKETVSGIQREIEELKKYKPRVRKQKVTAGMLWTDFPK